MPPGTLVTISTSASEASSASGHTYYGRNALQRKQRKRHKLGKVEMIRPDRALITAPILDGIQHKLPLRVDKLFGSINLPNNALRPMANVWIHWSRKQLLENGKVVSPLRLVAERRRHRSQPREAT
jgi:hypothetical protein